MILLSLFASAYEDHILQAVNNKNNTIKYSILTFLLLGIAVAITSISLFIRHFPRYAIRMIAVENPITAQKLDDKLTPQLLNNVTLITIIILCCSGCYVAYEVFETFN